MNVFPERRINSDDSINVFRERRIDSDVHSDRRMKFNQKGAAPKCPFMDGSDPGANPAAGWGSDPVANPAVFYTTVDPWQANY